MIDRCQLTGKASIPCVLIRYKGRGGSQFTLSSHYTPFLLRLWTIYRMDLLIKIHVRACLGSLWLRCCVIHSYALWAAFWISSLGSSFEGRMPSRPTRRTRFPSPPPSSTRTPTRSARWPAASTAPTRTCCSRCSGGSRSRRRSGQSVCGLAMWYTRPDIPQQRWRIRIYIQARGYSSNPNSCSLLR